jgi:hypothetical protein
MKNFAKNILSILNSIKAKEESEQKQEALAAQRSPIRDVKFVSSNAYFIYFLSIDHNSCPGGRLFSI